MKKIISRQWLCYLTILLLALAFAGCGNQTQAPQQDGNITVRIEIPDLALENSETNQEPVAYETKFTEAENQTALSLLIDAGKICGFPVVYSQSGSGYVEGIDGVFQFDAGPESGWIYFVNGQMPPVGAGEYEPAAEDVILWQYITSYDQLNTMTTPDNAENTDAKN